VEFCNVVGVQFRTAGRIYSFDGGSLKLHKGEQVVVETERGPSLGVVVNIGFFHVEQLGGRTIKPILRVAGPKDLRPSEKLTPGYVEEFVKDLVRQLSLNMKILDAEVQFGGNKVLVFFTAPGRVDFRELVKQLASGLRSRVELKQVGARDEAKLIGGLGVCGREFCCSTFLREFVPVSIKMAKNQNLALNPKKVSGGCGRLLCCLTYEDDHYQAVRSKMPPRGSRVKDLEDGTSGGVIKLDYLNQRVVIEMQDGSQRSVDIAQIEVLARGRDADEELDTWGDDLDPKLFEEDQPSSGLDAGGPEEPGAAPGRGPDKHHGAGNRPAQHSQSQSRPDSRQDPRRPSAQSGTSGGVRGGTDKPPQQRPRGEEPKRGERGPGQNAERGDSGRHQRPRQGKSGNSGPRNQSPGQRRDPKAEGVASSSNGPTNGTSRPTTPEKK
jgi:cell fate regulator YaaT (PSP1 superfamily)